jgi:hypothetical protein
MSNKKTPHRPRRSVRAHQQLMESGKHAEERTEAQRDEANDYLLTEVYDLIGRVMKRFDTNPETAASSVLSALCMNTLNLNVDFIAPWDPLRDLAQRFRDKMRMPPELFCAQHRLMLDHEKCPTCALLGEPATIKPWDFGARCTVRTA